MLEQMRKQGASIFVYLIFCLLIAIFVINFRPGQSRQDDNGCRGTTNEVVAVDGNEVTHSAFLLAYSSPYNWGTGAKNAKIQIALETLIRRELLAGEAEKRGLMVTEDLVMEEIKKGHFFTATPPPPGQAEDVEAIYRPVKKNIQGIFTEDGLWSLKGFNNWLASLNNISRNAYIEEQRRGMLAAMMADILQESVQVSREEALSQYLFQSNTASYDVVAFQPATFRSALKVTDADIERYLKDHASEVEARYKTDERTYKATKPALKLRQIFIAKAEDPAPAAPTPPTETGSGSGSGSGSAAPKTAPKVADKKPGMTIDAAKAKLEQVKKDGKDKFAAAAKDLNTDDNAKANGGDIGWHSADNAALGDKAVNDAVKTLKPGEMTPVIATDKGVFLVLAEDKREGDLSFDQVKKELGWEMAKDFWAKEAAKRAAIAALGEVKGKSLDEVYPAEAPHMNSLEDLLNDPNMPADQKAKLRQLIQQQQQGGGDGPHGALETAPEKDVPAGWFETQEKTGSAAAGSGSGSGSGSAAPAPAPAPATDVVATKDVLPALGDVGKAHSQRFMNASRAKQMNGLGQSKEAIAAVFDELKPGEVAQKVYEAAGSFIIVQLVQRNQPDVAQFDKDADLKVSELRKARSEAFLDEWLRDKCETLAKANRIKPNASLLAERDDNGKELPTTYKPCMTMH